jgi:hypothetical protein
MRQRVRGRDIAGGRAQERWNGRRIDGERDMEGTYSRKELRITCAHGGGNPRLSTGSRVEYF